MDRRMTWRAAARPLTLSLVTLSLVAGQVHGASAQPVATSIHLRGTGATTNPATLFLDTAAPLSAAPKIRDAGAIRFAGGNPWKQIGTWQAAPFVTDEAGAFGTFVMDLEPLHVWLGLVNSDDQGTKFDLKVEIFKNTAPLPIAADTLRCIAGLARDPNKAAEVVLFPELTSPQLFNGINDVLKVTLSARIGTNVNDTQCAGSHASAAGLRAYFDAARRDSRLDADLSDGNRVIGTITADIIGRMAPPSGETPLGDLVADSELVATQSAGAQIALMNPGGVRADLVFAASAAGEAPGQVTYGEAFRVLPFGFGLVTMTLTGAELRDVLEQQFPGFAGQTVQRILAVSSGLTYTWRGSAPPGSKISNLLLNGTPIDPAASYRVTVSDFLANGGDGLSRLTGGTNLVSSAASDLDALIAYLGAFSPVAPPSANRILQMP